MPFLYSLTILVPIFMESDTIRNTLPNCPTMNVTLPIAMAAVPNIAIHLPRGHRYIADCGGQFGIFLYPFCYLIDNL